MKRNKQYFDHNIIQADMAQVLVTTQPKSDVHFYTYPCKKYSAIADLHGARTGDEQYLHAFRMAAIEQPEMFVLENVPGMKKFKVVMEAFTKLPGYYIKLFCPVNASNWLPQRRERLIIFATKKPFNISQPKQAKKRPLIRDIIEENPKVHVPDTVISRIKGQYRDLPIIVDPEDKNSIAPTAVAHYAKDMGTRLVKDKAYKHGLRPFTIREYARLQGVPDDYIFEDKNFSYTLIGNGVAVPKARWIGEQVIRYFNKRA